MTAPSYAEGTLPQGIRSRMIHGVNGLDVHVLEAGHTTPGRPLVVLLHRHPNRPAQMHFLVTAPGYQKLVTHTFVGDDPWIGSDAVFGVKATLVAPFEHVQDGRTAWLSPFDFVLTLLD